MLAQNLAMEFVDLDKFIIQHEGRTIRDMVADCGWDFFRKIEKELLLKISRQKKQVIATGGGAVLHQDIWPQIMTSGLVVWLKANIATVQDRLLKDQNSATQRPSLTGNDPITEAEETMRIREPLYQKSSHLMINTEQPIGKIIETTVKQVDLLWLEAHLAKSLE